MRKKKFVFSTDPFPTYNYPDYYLLSQPEPQRDPHHSQSLNIPTNNTTPIHHYSRSPLDSH